ncbi:hypothetical protein [Caldimonas brevitalea]|uniref:Universal stress protein n=1 Tax=Caldimonas brevitalea TaxID=413882 RepID=A0A0G3BBS6_9BURK|nr:hypothetical protein [Caldimonas brevitalea]AKJ26784.1 hypothetical protein AAW51_0093 [Caldimonas brevitalea]
MKKIVVLLDDAAHAQQHLVSRLCEVQGERCILVACAPRLTHRASKWMSHGSREHWRSKWAAKLFGQMRPWLERQGVEAEAHLAKGPLQELMQELEPDELIDVRRPKLETAAEPAVDLPQRLDTPADAEPQNDDSSQPLPGPGVPSAGPRPTTLRCVLLAGLSVGLAMHDL